MSQGGELSLDNIDIGLLKEVPLSICEKNIKKLIKAGFGIRIYKKDLDIEGNIINDAISKNTSDIQQLKKPQHK